MIVDNPETCTAGAKTGLYNCTNVLIPSLFPFTVLVLFLIGTGVLNKGGRQMLFIFLLSLVGGYPIGAKLIRELVDQETLKLSNARKYIPLCINAGPGFIIIAVGKSILGSSVLGYILLISHILSSIIITLIFAPEIFTGKTNELKIAQDYSLSKNLVDSVRNAASTTLKICSFVVFFSVIDEYILFYSKHFPRLKYSLNITEITMAINNTRNLYLIAFLLGFAGISIWLQIYSVAGTVKPALFNFLAIRTLHGVLSAAITFITVKLFKINILTIGNGKEVSGKIFFSNYSLAVSLLIMTLLFIINIRPEKHSGKFINDVL